VDPVHVRPELTDTTIKDGRIRILLNIIPILEHVFE
jgi:hypothetical protein